MEWVRGKGKEEKGAVRREQTGNEEEGGTRKCKMENLIFPSRHS